MGLYCEIKEPLKVHSHANGAQKLRKILGQESVGDGQNYALRCWAPDAGRLRGPACPRPSAPYWQIHGGTAFPLVQQWEGSGPTSSESSRPQKPSLKPLKTQGCRVLALNTIREGRLYLSADYSKTLFPRPAAATRFQPRDGSRRRSRRTVRPRQPPRHWPSEEAEGDDVIQRGDGHWAPF